MHGWPPYAPTVRVTLPSTHRPHTANTSWFAICGQPPHHTTHFTLRARDVCYLRTTLSLSLGSTSTSRTPLELQARMAAICRELSHYAVHQRTRSMPCEHKMTGISGQFMFFALRSPTNNIHHSTKWQAYTADLSSCSTPTKYNMTHFVSSREYGIAG